MTDKIKEFRAEIFHKYPNVKDVIIPNDQLYTNRDVLIKHKCGIDTRIYVSTLINYDSREIRKLDLLYKVFKDNKMSYVSGYDKSVNSILTIRINNENKEMKLKDLISMSGVSTERYQSYKNLFGDKPHEERYIILKNLLDKNYPHITFEIPEKITVRMNIKYFHPIGHNGTVNVSTLMRTNYHRDIEILDNLHTKLQDLNIKYISGYTNFNTNAIFELEDGTQISYKPKNLFKGNSTTAFNKFLYLQEALNRDPQGKEYTWMEEFVAAGVPIDIRHDLCGHIYKVRPAHMLKNEGKGIRGTCPICSQRGVSNSEMDLKDYIKTLTSNKIHHSYRKLLHPKEIDLYIPSRKLAIEYNGNYWHSIDFKPQDYHQEKSIMSADKGVKLLHIFESDWNQNKDVTSRFLNKELSKNIMNLHFESSYIKEIPAADAIEFYENNKLRYKFNKIKTSTSFGLFHDDVLTSVLTLNERNSTILEYGDILDYKIYNSLGSFINYIKDNKSVKTLKVELDLSLNNYKDNDFTKNGFELISVNKPKVMKDIKTHIVYDSGSATFKKLI